MILKEALKQGVIQLKKNNIQSPELKARLLLQHKLNVTREYLIINDTMQIEERTEKQYFEAIQEIIQGKPLQHITNKQEFMGMTFFVNEDVLIPRPDTENLVEEVINLIKKDRKEKNKEEKVRILDLCTGSGAIAVSIAKYVEECKIIAIDISQKALKVAKTNAKINDTEEKIEFMQSDLFKNLNEKIHKFDIIVSNPPYIETETIKKLDIEVQKEPLIALDGGIDGLDFYRKIIENSGKFLNKNGYLCFEIGYNQKQRVIEILEKYKFKEIYCKKDIGDNDRVIISKVGE